MKEFLNIEEEVIYNKLMPNRLQQENAAGASLYAADLSGCGAIMDVEKLAKNVSELGELILTLKETSENYAFRPLFSESKIFGKGIIFAKKATRKLLKWYIEPICFQQTAFNNAVTHSIEQIAKIQAELIVSVSELTRLAQRKEAEAAGEVSVPQDASSTPAPQETAGSGLV
ncbi:MAG: hypothetical protein ABFC56_16150 [Clostridiaceae bacterium]